jgi:VanZ family protein
MISIQKLSSIASWVVFAFIVCATLSPIEHRPTLPTGPGFEHVAAFIVLGALFSVAYPRKTAFVFVLVLGGAVLLELAQTLTPDRHGRILDAVEKMIGGGIGIVIAQAMRIWSPRVGFRTNRG